MSKSKPCPKCKLYQKAQCDQAGGMPDDHLRLSDDCPEYQRWLGREEGLAEAESKNGACGLCGGPMSKNPHPDAGKPGKHVEVGAIYECIPCNRKALHGWSVRATQAESDARETKSRVAREIVEFVQDMETLDSIDFGLKHQMVRGNYSSRSAILKEWLQKRGQ